MSVISVITNISKWLKESGGAASSYQQSVEFLGSVGTTLEGVKHIVDTNAHLTWRPAIVAQAKRLQIAIEGFIAKAKKFDNSLSSDSERSKLRQAPRYNGHYLLMKWRS